MTEVSYRPLIEDMTWSYSRVSSFSDCPYQWFLNYIKGYEEIPMFYSSYGTLMHDLVEGFYKGVYKKEDLLPEFLLRFKKEVQGEIPSDTIVRNYIQNGIQYFSDFQPLDEQFGFSVVDVEKEVRFQVGDYKFLGYIDFIGEKDGDLYIVDNKSRNLKNPKKGKRSEKSKQEIAELLKQLYLYSAAVEQIYGKYPKQLCLHSFRSGETIFEEFNLDDFVSVRAEMLIKIQEIMDTSEFLPDLEYFKCRFLCGHKNDCCYYEMR